MTIINAYEIHAKVYFKNERLQSVIRMDKNGTGFDIVGSPWVLSCVALHGRRLAIKD